MCILKEDPSDFLINHNFHPVQTLSKLVQSFPMPGSIQRFCSLRIEWRSHSSAHSPPQVWQQLTSPALAPSSLWVLHSSLDECRALESHKHSHGISSLPPPFFFLWDSLPPNLCSLKILFILGTSFHFFHEDFFDHPRGNYLLSLSYQGFLPVT